MIKLPTKDYENKVRDFYYRKVWKENQALYDTTGAGPYPNDPQRTRPWLDYDFYMGMEAWLRKEYHAAYEIEQTEYIFETQNHANWFVLRWT